MKNLGKLAVLGAALAVSSSFAFADSISLSSWGSIGLLGSQIVGSGNATTYVGSEDLSTTAAPTTAPNLAGFTGGGGSAVELNPEVPVWNANLGNSSWVGINANAGPQSTTNPQYGYYEFTDTFSVAGGNYNGSLNVLADDTTEVFLDNSTTPFVTFASPGTHCASGVPDCLTVDTVGLGGLNLASGSHTLTFIVEQEGDYSNTGNDPSGLDFTASLSSTPEPSSLMLLGTGLTSAAGMLFRRRRQTV